MLKKERPEAAAASSYINFVDNSHMSIETLTSLYIAPFTTQFAELTPYDLPIPDISFSSKELPLSNCCYNGGQAETSWGIPEIRQ